MGCHLIHKPRCAILRIYGNHELLTVLHWLPLTRRAVDGILQCVLEQDRPHNGFARGAAGAPARGCGPAPNRAAGGDAALQPDLLRGVARSFALTLAQLPEPLRAPASNLYLLCRIADTIEDDPALSPAQKQDLSARWVDVVEGRAAPEPLARRLQLDLSPSITAAERKLVAAASGVVAITHGFRDPQRRALERCVRIMTRGMVEFQYLASPHGLPDMPHLDRYCYHVAGVVGETLTELFCDYSTEIAGRREELLALSTSFGQGLQMVNVLKDMWEDQRRGVCWLPRDVFRAAGVDDLRTLCPGRADDGYVQGLTVLAATARHHLANALRYILIIPRHEAGIRRSCLWPLGLAVRTLRRIQATPAFTHGRQVKVKRPTVWTVAAVTGVLVRSNSALRLLFQVLHLGLPPTTAGVVPSRARLAR